MFTHNAAHQTSKTRRPVWLWLVAAIVIAGAGAFFLLKDASDEQSMTVVVAGDIACPAEKPAARACKDGETARLATSLKPDAVLVAGDTQYPNGTLEEFMGGYDKTWGALKDITFPTPGNHEYVTPGASGYFDYFGAQAGERGKGYYAKNLGTWRLIVLNSEINIGPSSQQMRWLEQELTQNPADCTLALWHRPRFTSGGHQDEPKLEPLWRLLYDHRVELVLNGHSHAYERYLPQTPDGRLDTTRGIVEIVSGMGGYSAEKLADQAGANLATRQNHAFGVLKLDLRAGAADFAFASIPGQTFKDSGRLTCN